MMVIAELVEALRLLVQGVPGLTTLASAPYLFRPLVMLVVLGVVCAIVGVAVNLRCAEFQAEALVHAVFPGIVAGAVYLGTEGIVPAGALRASWRRRSSPGSGTGHGARPRRRGLLWC